MSSRVAGVSLSSMTPEDTWTGEHLKNKRTAIPRSADFRTVPKSALRPLHRPSCSEWRLSIGPASSRRHALPAVAAEIHYAPGEDLERVDVALLREAASKSTWRPMW